MLPSFRQISGRHLPLFAAVTLCFAGQPRLALAWGYEGHEVVAAIAQGYLRPDIRQKADALLAADLDTLTAPDFISRSTWADAWRGAGHRQTSQWHYADMEMDSPSLSDACFGFPSPVKPVSGGPARACVVDRVMAFSDELADPRTSQPEKILALKFLLHFVGDLHQPLHVFDNHDRGGNCLRVSMGGSRTTTLHGYWDTTVVEDLGRDPADLASRLRAQITPAQKAAWERGDPRAWATETFGVARNVAYPPGATGGCRSDAAPIVLPATYLPAARAVAALQLQRAGVRLALILNRALAHAPAVTRYTAPQVRDRPASQSSKGSPRTSGSVECSARADALGLHGKPRQSFRRSCRKDLG